MNDAEKRWIEIQFHFIIKDLYNACNGDITIVNTMIEQFVKIAVIENPDYITKVANAILKLDYLRPSIQEYIAFAMHFNMTQKSIAKRLNTTQPNISYHCKRIKEEVKTLDRFLPTVEDKGIETLFQFINAVKFFKKGVFVDYDQFSRDDEIILQPRRDWFNSDSLPAGSDDSNLQY